MDQKTKKNVSKKVSIELRRKSPHGSRQKVRHLETRIIQNRAFFRGLFASNSIFSDFLISSAVKTYPRRTSMTQILPSSTIFIRYISCDSWIEFFSRKIGFIFVKALTPPPPFIHDFKSISGSCLHKLCHFPSADRGTKSGTVLKAIQDLFPMRFLTILILMFYCFANFSIWKKVKKKDFWGENIKANLAEKGVRKSFSSSGVA